MIRQLQTVRFLFQGILFLMSIFQKKINLKSGWICISKDRQAYNRQCESYKQKGNFFDYDVDFSVLAFLAICG